MSQHPTSRRRVDVLAIDYCFVDVLTINALKSAFLPFDERLALIEDIVKPGYSALMS